MTFTRDNVLRHTRREARGDHAVLRRRPVQLSIPCRHITLRLEGDLVIGDDGKYSFKGKLRALPDRYHMYSSDHRNDADEAATRAGEAIGAIGHHDYTIHILGEKPISSAGPIP